MKKSFQENKQNIKEDITSDIEILIRKSDCIEITTAIRTRQKGVASPLHDVRTEL